MGTALSQRDYGRDYSVTSRFIGPILSLVNMPVEAQGEARNYLMIVRPAS